MSFGVVNDDLFVGGDACDGNAGFVGPACRIFDPIEVDRGAQHSQEAKRQAFLDRLVEKGPWRRLATAHAGSVAALEKLATKFPNFSSVIDHIADQVSLSVLSRDHCLGLSPLLLHGAPGVGKTRFIREVSEALRADFHFVSCSTVTAGFVLSGSHATWSGARPGEVSLALVDGETANPIILLDEVDKMAGDRNCDPFGPLYTLLERTTAAHFKDEFAEVRFDASHMIWVATANDPYMLSAPLLSRFVTIEVPSPTRKQMRLVVVSIYHDLLDEHASSWGSVFCRDLPNGVVERLSEQSPRQIRLALLQALGKVARKSLGKVRDSYEISLADFEGARGLSKQGFGFVGR